MGQWSLEELTGQRAKVEQRALRGITTKAELETGMPKADPSSWVMPLKEEPMAWEGASVDRAKELDGTDRGGGSGILGAPETEETWNWLTKENWNWAGSALTTHSENRSFPPTQFSQLELSFTQSCQFRQYGRGSTQFPHTPLTHPLGWMLMPAHAPGQIRQGSAQGLRWALT